MRVIQAVVYSFSSMAPSTGAKDGFILRVERYVVSEATPIGRADTILVAVVKTSDLPTAQGARPRLKVNLRREKFPKTEEVA